MFDLRKHPILVWLFPVLLFPLAGLFLSCAPKVRTDAGTGRQMPGKILWAWERPEDLRFLDPQEFGVAFLAQTLVLNNDGVDFRPRRQPLEVKPETYLIAVTRIETDKSADGRPVFSEEQRTKVVNFVKNSLQLPRVRAIQIDFDALVSERPFYRELLTDLRKNLPENTPLTMTALASWCLGDGWFGDLPVDEAVPMAFVMGADSRPVRDFLKQGNDWREPLCRRSYGLSVDDPVAAEFKPDRRFYYFKSKAWNAADVEKIVSGER